MKKESKSFVTTKKLVISAVLSALSFVFMYLGALSGVLDLCSAVVGALCCAFAVIELRGVWPWLICTVAGTLSLIFLPDKFAALEYIVLGGLYPILKSFIERIPGIASFFVKLPVFNILLTLCLLAARFLFGLSDDWVAFNVTVYLIANVFFVIYDLALTTLISYYLKRLRGRLKLWL